MDLELCSFLKEKQIQKICRGTSNFFRKKAIVGQEVPKIVSMYSGTKNRLVKPNDCSMLNLPICLDAAYTYNKRRLTELQHEIRVTFATSGKRKKPPTK